MATGYSKKELVADIEKLGVPILEASDIRLSTPRKQFEGRFTDVYKASQLPTERIVAVKITRSVVAASLGVIEATSGSFRYKRARKTLDYFKRECGIGWRVGQQNSAKSHNIVPLYGIIADMSGSALPVLVMEYIEGGRLIEFCSNNNSSLGEKLHLLGDVANALRFLHSKQIVHRDIRPENILVESSPPSRNIALLADFGSSKIFELDDETGLFITDVSTNQSDAIYAPPEYQDGPNSVGFHDGKQGYGDIWSLACVSMELLCNEKPWVGKSAIGVRLALSRGQSPSIPSRDFITEDISLFLKKCLKVTPAERLTAKQAFDDLRRLAETH